MDSKKINSVTDAAFKDNQNTIMQDFALQENLANFVRETTPERSAFAKGSGAYGKFTVTKEIPNLTKAGIFSDIGNSCKIFVRFSSLLSEKGGADAERDTKGFAVKFYTDDGNWDLVGSNSPVFFVKDGKKFPALMQSQKRDPKTNLRDRTAMWDFYSQNPETLHQLLILESERGIPQNFRQMHGYGAHTYSFINENGERHWVKFHLKTEQGIKNLGQTEALKINGENPDFAQEDLVENIQNGNFPKWKLCIQTMTEEQAKEWRWNPFDVTKVWFQDEFPLMEIGEIELNEIPENYFMHVEQAAFSPSNIISGISFSPDKVLQSRLFSYKDAQRHRIGLNAQQLEVNRSLANKKTSEYAMEEPYIPTYSQNENEKDHYTQPGLFYTKALKSQTERDILAENIVKSMMEISGPHAQEIKFRQICHFFRANIELGMKIAAGLHLNIDANLMNHAVEN